MRFASVLHPLTLLSPWGFGLYSSQRNLPAQAGLSDNKKRRQLSSFSTSTVTLYLVWGEWGRGSKNYQEIKRGHWTNSAFANGGGHYIIISPLKLISQSPLLIIIAQSLTVVAKFLDLDRDGHLHCRTMEKKSMDYRFAPEYNRAQRLRRCQFFFSVSFFCHICRILVC